MRTPMKVLIAAANELHAKDEGLEALWDRFLIRMVSNCIESDVPFFKMLKEVGQDMSELPEHLFITDELYSRWQNESKAVGIHDTVVCAIKALRKSLAVLEKEDGNQLRYYISDRRWRKAYRLMQTSAYLNGRSEIDLSDYMLLIHSFWNDVECIPNILNAFTSSISDTVLKSLTKIDRSIRQLMTPSRQTTHQSAPSRLNTDKYDFAEYDYFYYLVENYPAGDTYFSKWDYTALSDQPRDGVRYYDSKHKKIIIHTIVPGRPFDAKSQNASNLTKVKIQRCNNGAIIDGTPYAFRRNTAQPSTATESIQTLPAYQRISLIQTLFKNCVDEWEKSVRSNWNDCGNIFLSANDLALVNKMLKEVNEQIKTIDVKLNNVLMMIK